MAGRKSDFTLPTLDDLFSTQEMRDDAKLAKIRDIPLELIDDFPDHPFKVRDDEDMMQLVESVKERGVITPARQPENRQQLRHPQFPESFREAVAGSVRCGRVLRRRPAPGGKRTAGLPGRDLCQKHRCL